MMIGKYQPVRYTLLIITCILLSLTSFAQAQKKIKLIKADAIEYNENFVRAQRLIGHVILEHEGSRMFCDSAYLYEGSNRFEAFGNVRITDQEQLNITGKRLDYFGDDKLAKIYEDITLRDGEMTLTTDYIEYHLDERRASYFEGGKIVSTANSNVLESQSGHYFAESKVMHFKEDVELTNPEYTMYTDTLHYHSYNEQSYFLGPTRIESDENRIYCENGWYDTQNDRARFGENAHIWSNEQQLLGDSIYYDRNEGFGEAYGNVVIIDTLNRLQISGQFGRHEEIENISYVTQEALMEQFFDADTLLLSADTLLMTSDTLDLRRIQAYRGVRIFKPDLQGICDSLIYTEADSLISMYYEPYIWSEQNQISGERIDLRTFDGNITDLYAGPGSFIISEVDTSHYNQIKGRQLHGIFRNNEIRDVFIEGNGESIYYAVEDDEDSLSTAKPKIIGVNKSTCSDIRIDIRDRTISRVHFITNPDNAFYPLDKFPTEEQILKGFAWKAEFRPLKASDLKVTSPLSD